MLVFTWPDGRRQIVDPNKQLQRFERVHPARRAKIYERTKRRVHELTEPSEKKPES